MSQPYKPCPECKKPMTIAVEKDLMGNPHLLTSCEPCDIYTTEILEGERKNAFMAREVEMLKAQEDLHTLASARNNPVSRGELEKVQSCIDALEKENDAMAKKLKSTRLVLLVFLLTALALSTIKFTLEIMQILP